MNTKTDPVDPDNQTPTNVPPVGNTDATSGAPDDKNKTYDSGFVDKLKGEKDNYKSKALELEQRLSEIEARTKSENEQRLKDQNDFKSLYEAKTKDYEALQSKVDGFEKSKVDSKKTKALAEELKKLGIRDAYLEKASNLADLTKIKIDNENGAVYGADVLAQNLNNEWPDLFGKSDPSVTHGAPERRDRGTALTLDEWKSLPYKEKMERQHEVMATAKK